MAIYTFKHIQKLKKFSKLALPEQVSLFPEVKDVTLEHNAETAAAADKLWKTFYAQQRAILSAGAQPVGVILSLSAYKVLIASCSHKAHDAVVVSHMENCLIMVNPQQTDDLCVVIAPEGEFLYETELKAAREVPK
jgi:hypothetical protein